MTTQEANEAREKLVWMVSPEPAAVIFTKEVFFGSFGNMEERYTGTMCIFGTNERHYCSAKSKFELVVDDILYRVMEDKNKAAKQEKATNEQ